MRVRMFIFMVSALFLFPGQMCFGQLCFPAKKLYAFFQPVSKGAVSIEEAKSNKANGNYLVFIESRRTGISLNHIWIKGVLHNGYLKEVTTPVTLSQPGSSGPIIKTNNPVLVVPASKHTVYQVMFTALDTSTAVVSMPEKYASKPLVMQLQYKKRKKHITGNEIRQVSGDAMY